jgi:hypothetical protein
MAFEIKFDRNYLVLYNEAIDKIFKNYTEFTSVHNPKHFRLVELEDVYYPTDYPLVDDEELTDKFVNQKKADDETKKKVKDEMKLCRKKFLDFMHKNLYDSFEKSFKGLNGADKYLSFEDIVKKVHQFINLMEVKMTGTDTDTDSQIVVTLHDIINKSSSTSSVPNYCISEKLFMAILLAIQKLHCPTPSPDRQYTLKFEFAPSLIGKSSLHQSSIKCSNNNDVMSNFKNKEDPVAENIFNFDLTRLTPKMLPALVVSEPYSTHSYFHDSDSDSNINSNISDLAAPLDPTQAGGSKSRRRHRRHHKSKHARKTRRGRGRKSKPKPKTHRRRSARHSRIRKHKKYTSRVR